MVGGLNPKNTKTESFMPRVSRSLCARPAILTPVGKEWEADGIHL